MKALEILKHKWTQGNVVYDNDTEKHTRYLKYDEELIHKAIKELEDLQNENKSLVKTLEKYNEEMIELRKSNQDLLNTIIEAQEAIKNILEGIK